MKWLLALALPVCLAGCVTGEQNAQKLEPEQEEAASIMLATGLLEASAVAGTVKQHTLFPYHFVENTADLNELGEKELRVLADHYREHGGPLNLRRDRATPDLHEERMEAMVAFLKLEGVDTSRVRLVETPMGGEGMMSVHVLENLEQGDRAPASGAGGGSTDLGLGSISKGEMKQ